MESKIRILVVGSINMDMLLITHRIPLAGESLIGRNYSTIAGGKGANQAVAAALLGADVDFAGKVGSDEHGKKLTELLAKKHVSTKLLNVDQKIPTGLAVIMLEDDGQNRIIVYPGANTEINKEEIHHAYKNEYDAVIVQFEVPVEIVVETCRIAVQKKIPVFVDAGPAQDFPLESIYGIDILSPNETEVFAMCGIEPDTIEKAEQAAKILKQRSGARFVVIKLGSRGALLFTDEETLMIPALKVQVVDTTAAGDAFTAALAIEYLKSRDIQKAVKFANLVGAITVTRLGAQPSLPAIDEVNEFMRNFPVS